MTPEAVPQHVREFRLKFRSTELPRWYSGHAHVAATVVFTAGCALWAVSSISSPTAIQGLTVPIMLLVGNLFEYALHRGPLHHPWPLVRKVFDIHVGNHHHYYTHEAMLLGDHRDIYMVLFPWWAPLLIVLALPLAAMGLLRLFTMATGVGVSTNVMYLMVAVGALNFLLYEFMHFSFHLPANPVTDWLPGMAALRKHHTLHHDPRYMTMWNFNVVCPLADVIFQTRR